MRTGVAPAPWREVESGPTGIGPIGVMTSFHPLGLRPLASWRIRSIGISKLMPPLTLMEGRWGGGGRLHPGLGQTAQLSSGVTPRRQVTEAGGAIESTRCIPGTVVYVQLWTQEPGKDPEWPCRAPGPYPGLPGVSPEPGIPAMLSPFPSSGHITPAVLSAVSTRSD